MELRGTGVKVTIINPGDFKSDFTQNRERVPFTLKNEKLEAQYNSAVASMEKDESIGSDPAIIGKKLCEIVEKSSPAHRYLVGAIGQTIAVTLKSILPNGWFELLMSDHYGIK